MTQSEYLPLAVTLNSVEKAQDVGSKMQVRDGERFYLIGDFTFKNLGDKYLKVEKPDAVPVSDESAIVNDELKIKGDLLGTTGWFLDKMVISQKITQRIH